MEKKQLFIKWLKIFGIVLGILVALSVIATLIYSAVVKVNPVSAFTSFFKSDKAEIIGIWEDDDFDGATAFVFREDGTYDRYISTANFPGEYTIDGNKIILKNANSELTLTYKYRLSGDHLYINTIDSIGGGGDLGEETGYHRVDKLSQRSLNDLIAEAKDYVSQAQEEQNGDETTQANNAEE